MGCDIFRFKRFAVRQSGVAMKVGTDGVLLGAWCDLADRPEWVLDIGTGTGLLALMIAQRCEGWECRVDAVEIDGEACVQASANFAASPWGRSITAHHETVQDFVRRGHRAYDLIISNPPYFENSLQCPDGQRTGARHAVSLPRNELIGCAAACLTDGGRFAVIIPHRQTAQFCAAAADHGLYLNKWTEVSPVTGSEPHRSMLLFDRRIRHDVVVPARLVIESGGRHDYSSEYVELTSEFYLKF